MESFFGHPLKRIFLKYNWGHPLEFETWFSKGLQNVIVFNIFGENLGPSALFSED